MPQEDIEAAMKLGFTYETVVFPELCTFGIHTSLRLEAQWTAVFTAMQDFLEDLVSVLVPVEGRQLTLSEWSTVGFVGWHQIASIDDSASTYGGSTELPHQLQGVIGYVNDTESGVAVGRRRNRSYIGPMNSGTVDNSDGRIGDALTENMLDAFQTLDNTLRTIANTVASDFAGIDVVSEAEGVMMEANRAKCGKKYDIHRSRAQKTPESYSVIVL